jgi:small subunit ribosomal protein S20
LLEKNDIENKFTPECTKSKFLHIFAAQFLDKMANHKSAIKRIRSNDAKRLRNKYFHKTTRNAVRKLRALTSRKEAEALLGAVAGMLDKLAKNNVIHKNKAANLKSSLQIRVNGLK